MTQTKKISCDYLFFISNFVATFRINSTHIFMVGGLSNAYNLTNVFDEGPTDNTGCPTEYPRYLVEVIGNNSVGGGTYFKEAWIFDGSEWTAIKPMWTIRDTPSCSLVEMDDGEVENQN